MFLSAKMCVPDNDNKIGLTPLFNNYREYCRDNNQKAETRENFKMKLKSEGYVVEEDNKKGVKIGINSSKIRLSLPLIRLLFFPCLKGKMGEKGVEKAIFITFFNFIYPEISKK